MYLLIAYSNVQRKLDSYIFSILDLIFLAHIPPLHWGPEKQICQLMPSHLLSVPSPLSLQQSLSERGHFSTVPNSSSCSVATIGGATNAVLWIFSGYWCPIWFNLPGMLDVCSQWVWFLLSWIRTKRSVHWLRTPYASHTVERLKSAWASHFITGLAGPSAVTMATSPTGSSSSIIYFPQFPPRTIGLLNTSHLHRSWQSRGPPPLPQLPNSFILIGTRSQSEYGHFL